MSRPPLHRAIAVAGILAVVVLAAGCSSSKAVRDATGTTIAPTTTGDEATSTTAATPITEAPTTAVVTSTTAAPAPAGWTPVDPATLPGSLAFPCCGSNWTGLASPALPAAGAALADGVYAIRFDWPSDFSQPVTATVTRFELCTALPANTCEDASGTGTYAANEIGIDESASFTLPLTFDDQLHIVLGGFDGYEGQNFATANGLDIAALVTALDADYQAAIMQPYLAGTSQDAIAAALIAAPAHGFGAPADGTAGMLAYTRDGAPPLLFQGLVGFDDSPQDARGSDIIGRITLVVSGGTLTLNLYAGFYS